MGFKLPDVYYQEVDESEILRQPGMAKFGAFTDAKRGYVGQRETDSGLYTGTTSTGYIDEFGKPKTPAQLAIVDTLRAGRVPGVNPYVEIKRVLPRDEQGDLLAFWGGVKYNTTDDSLNGIDTAEEVTYPVDNYVPATDISFAIFDDNPNDEGDLKGIAIDADAGESDEFLVEVYVREDASDDFPLTPEEEHLVTLEDKQSQTGEQLEIEQKINAQSNLVVAVNNPEDNTIPVSVADPVTLAGGTAGPDVDVSDVETAIQIFRDAEQADVRGLINGGYSSITSPTISNEIFDIAASRRDMAAIIDTPLATDSDALINDWKENLTVPGYTENSGSYGFTYAPWVSRRERTTGKDEYVPPSGQVAQRATIVFNQQQPWFPLFGPERGVLNVDKLERKFSKEEMDLLYDNLINPIREVTDTGVTLWGNKTLQSYFSKTSQIHVRFLLITIEIAIAQFAQRYIGKFNNASTRRDLKRQVERYLQRVAGQDGFDTDDGPGYYVKIDEENNPPSVRQEQRLVGDIFVIPVDAIETIQLNFRVTESGVVEFEEQIA